MIRASGAPAAVMALPLTLHVALLTGLAAPSAGAETGARRPAVERRMTAEYPAWARGTGIETTVDLKVLVGRDARARRVVVEPYTVERDIMTRRMRASFDSAAVACVKRWTFRPAWRAGRPVAAWLRVEVLLADPGTDGAAASGPRDTLGRRDSVAKRAR